MFRIQKILCPMDFSKYAEAALPVACALAREHRAALVLLHVRPVTAPVVGEFGSVPPPPREPEQALKSAMERALPADFKGSVECLVKDGDAATEILEAARTQQCELIVMGTHGRTGLRRLVLGSVAEAVLRDAPCPVLTVKAPAETEPPAEWTSSRAKSAAPEVNRDQMVTVCAVANAMEAEMIRNALKTEKIAAFIEGAQQGGIVGTLGIPVKVQVRAADFDRASKLVRAREQHRR